MEIRQQSTWLRWFSIWRARQKKIQEKCYESYIENVQSFLKKNSQIIWSYIKSLRNHKIAYPNTLTLGNVTYNDKAEACEGFKGFFKSVFQQSASSYSSNQQPYADPNDNVRNLSVTVEYVLKVLKSLNPNKEYQLY